MAIWVSRFRLAVIVLCLAMSGQPLLFEGGAVAAEDSGCRKVRGMVILVEFPDTPHTVARAFVEDRFFGKLNSYVQDMSYGRVCISGEVTARWHRLPHPLDHYSISSRNINVDKGRVEGLVRDAFEALDADVDLSSYDFIALVLGAKQQEYGMIGLCAYPGMLGWQATSPLRDKNGKPVRGVAIFSYQAHIGTLFHDVAHVIGGVREDGKRAVPCLYDHDLQARPGPLRETFADSIINMGYWDPMSCHYYRPNEPPPGISSWTKRRLGWLPEDKVAEVRRGETREIVLGPLQDGRSDVLAIRIPLSATTYYLIENRQPLAADRVLPGSGVLIMHADDSIGECRQGRAPVKLVNAAPSVPFLEGAAFDIGKQDRYADAAAGVTITLLEKVGQSYRILVNVQP
ncbi:MAG: hypothetical protein ACOY3Z_01555 [Thermodesulfobacteriota bacterium]